jgi:tRNA-specific 2-thiouridylase
MTNQKIKGIGLLSGGLDSILAVKVLQEQGLDLLGITFTTPFFGADSALAAGLAVGIEVRVIDITEIHLQMLKEPRYGYGRYMNPCIDCHALMLREAGRIMHGAGADFLFTGEVLGQRPMSQRRDSLRSVEKLSGMEGLILRPLSAKLLPPSLVELDGRVDRSRLLDIHGRSRKRQIELAAHFQIRDYPNPAGGCLLTKDGFVRKLRDLLSARPDPGRREVELLKRGRHFRLPGGSKCVVGRSEVDNAQLQAVADPEWLCLQVPGCPGPLALMPEVQVSEPDLILAAKIIAAYCDAPVDAAVTVEWRQSGRGGRVNVTKEAPTSFRGHMI